MPTLAGAKTLMGHDVQVVTHGAQGMAYDSDVMVDGKSIEHDTTNASLELLGVYPFGGYGVALIEEDPGGNACPEMFEALIFAKSVTQSDDFGDCSDLPVISKTATGVVVNLPEMTGGNGRDVFTVDAQGVHEIHIPTHLVGPAFTPGMDLGALVLGRYVTDVFFLKATAVPIRTLIGDAMYQTILPAVVSSPFVEIDGYVAGSAFSNEISYQNVRFVFDHKGGLWVGTEDENGHVTWYGNPPAAAMAASDTQRNGPN